MKEEWCGGMCVGRVGVCGEAVWILAPWDGFVFEGGIWSVRVL